MFYRLGEDKVAQYRIKIRSSYNDRNVVVEDAEGMLVGTIKNAVADKLSLIHI